MIVYVLMDAPPLEDGDCQLNETVLSVAEATRFKGAEGTPGVEADTSVDHAPSPAALMAVTQ
jgi:hypothetical protein